MDAPPSPLSLQQQLDELKKDVDYLKRAEQEFHNEHKFFRNVLSLLSANVANDIVEPFENLVKEQEDLNNLKGVLGKRKGKETPPDEGKKDKKSKKFLLSCRKRWCRNDSRFEQGEDERFKYCSDECYAEAKKEGTPKKAAPAPMIDVSKDGEEEEDKGKEEEDEPPKRKNAAPMKDCVYCGEPMFLRGKRCPSCEKDQPAKQ